jgi:large conductance mechanosensitive channel
MVEKITSIMGEFKSFISRGNVIDLAVGIIIGAAFTGIVNSLVNDVVMPIIGLLTSGVDFSNIFIPLSLEKMDDTIKTVKAAKEAGIPIISVGVFINAVINFLIVSFVIFVLVKQINKLKRKEEAEKAPAAPAEDVVLLSEIRDILKNQIK